MTANFTQQIPEYSNVEIDWTGGEPVPGHKFQRRVSRTSPTHVKLTARGGNHSDTADVWVIWVELSTRTQGGLSIDNRRHFPLAGTNGEWYRGDWLGPKTDEDDDIWCGEATGKIEIVGAIQPAGAGNVLLEQGLLMRRWLNGTVFRNGIPFLALDQDDTSDRQAWQDLNPDNDEIFDIDGPVAGPAQWQMLHTEDRYLNFTEWATWNDERASDYLPWHYRAKIDDDLDRNPAPPNGRNRDTELNDVGPGAILVPISSAYATRPW